MAEFREFEARNHPSWTPKGLFDGFMKANRRRVSIVKYHSNSNLFSGMLERFFERVSNLYMLDREFAVKDFFIKINLFFVFLTALLTTLLRTFCNSVIY